MSYSFITYTLVTPHSSVIIVATAWSCGIESSVGTVSQSAFSSGARQLIEHYQACSLTKMGIQVGHSSCEQRCVCVWAWVHKKWADKKATIKR